MTRRAWLLPLIVALPACEPVPREMPSLLDEVEIAVRGHTELHLPADDPDGVPQPLFLSADSVPGLCIQAPPRADTTRWKLSHRYGSTPTGEGARSPVARLGRTVCFDVPFPDSLQNGVSMLESELVDEYDGRRATLPRIAVRRRDEDPGYERFLERFRSLMGDRSRLSNEQLLERLGVLGADASAAGFPFLAMRTRLVQVYFLRRTGRSQAHRAAEELLAHRPKWLDRPHADVWAAQHSYEHASLLLETGTSPGEVWPALSSAEEHYRRIADPRRVTVVMKQADALSMAGSAETGRSRLADAIEDCSESGCEPRFLGAAKNTLAWLTLQDPGASRDELLHVVSFLRENVAELPASDDLPERANALVNLAYGEARAGQDPSATLDASEELLARIESEPERRAWISLWGRLAAAIHAFAAGRTERALELCEGVSQESRTPDLTARSLACIARVQRARGDLTAADDAIQRALFIDEYSSLHTHEWSSPTAPAQRADRVFLAAQVALERDRPGQAWDLAASLDRRASNADCAALEQEEERERWNRLLLDLAALDGPASRGLRERRDEIRPVLMLEAQQTLRQRWGCGGKPESSSPAEIEFRAFAVDDHVYLLRRRLSGEVELYRTSDFPDGVLGRHLDRIAIAVQECSADRAQWTRLTAPIAGALVPRVEDLGARTTFALHGVLQRVPMIALPVPGEESGYLSDHTLVVFRPGLTDRLPDTVPKRDSGPLFVVDPLENLPGAASAASYYRALFPGARILAGRDADAVTISSALADASWFHIDAHGEFDPVFPELSRVRLADGAVPAVEWTEAAGDLELANLSMCAAGRWPVTADSGRFGIAGLFARRGARWVVAAQADLPNLVALDFNRRFYEQFAESGDVPGSFQDALRRVRDRHEPVEWASLSLLEGQSEPGRTLTAVQPGELP